MLKTPLLIAILFVALFEAVGQTCIKLAHMYNKLYMILAIISYAIVSFFLYVSYNYKGVGIVNALWSGLSIILMITIGLLFFKEKIGKREWLGIILIISGLLLINLTSKEN